MVDDDTLSTLYTVSQKTTVLQREVRQFGML